MVGVAVKTKVIHHLMGGIQNRSAGSLVHAAALHSYATVLADVNQANTVASANFVQFGHQFQTAHLLSVHADRDTFLKFNLHVLAGFGSVLRADGILEHVLVVGLILGLFQFQSFVADVPDVLVAAVGLVFFHRNFKSAVFQKFDFSVAAVHVPFGVTPCSDYPQVGSERLDCKLKTNLVVSLTSCAVADSRSTFLTGILNQNFSDKRARG